MTRLIEAGATFSAVAPSHGFTEADYQSGRAIVEAHGYRFIEEPGLREQHRWFAGADAHRLGSLVHACIRPDTQGVWAVRGGSGMTRLLPHLHVVDLAQKPILGFSDLTPLLDAVARAGGLAVHGPVLHSLHRTDQASVDQLFALLAGEPQEPLHGEVLVGGGARGTLVGGNLCLLAAGCGTPTQLDAQGGILVLEEIGEPLYKVDRMLQQLRLAGVFHGVQGVAIGSFTGCGEPGSPLLTEVFEDHLAPLGVPVLRGLPIGHGAANRSWIVRGEAAITDGTLVLPTAPPAPCC